MKMAYLKEECLDVCENGDIFTRDGKKLTHVSDRLGYLRVYCKGTDGKRKNYSVHRLVAKAFIPNPGNKPCVNHIDGVKSNFSLSNLEWCTHKENTVHAYKLGLMEPVKESQKQFRKMARYKAVKELIKLGYTRDFIAAAFETSITTITKITKHQKHFE